MFAPFTVVTPYTNDQGLRDYRAVAVTIAPPPRWPVLVILAVLLGFLFGSRAALGAEPCVQLRVRPIAMLQKGDIHIETRVCRDADHRSLLLSWDSDRGGAGSSYYPLEGNDAPVLFTSRLLNQPAANYQFDAAVADKTGRIVGRARQRIMTVDDAPE